MYSRKILIVMYLPLLGFLFVRTLADMLLMEVEVLKSPEKTHIWITSTQNADVVRIRPPEERIHVKGVSAIVMPLPAVTCSDLQVMASLLLVNG